MTVRSWAERLLHSPGSRDVIDLHVKDTVAALLTGFRIKDSQTILHRYGASSDRSERTAAVAAIARLSECDDIDLPSCVTAGAIVIPVALALSSDRDPSEVHMAVSAGYSAGTLIGGAIGGAHALSRGIWPTLFAAPVMAAVTAAVFKTRDPEQLAHAMALALASADGRVGNPAERWMLLSDAVLRGLHAVENAASGAHADLNTLPEGIGRAAFDGAFDGIAHVGFKPFPIARQGANAVVAVQRLLAKGIDPRRIDTVEVFVPATNVTLLKRPPSETDRLSRLCNMGLQLAAAALAPELLYDPERPLEPRGPLVEFASRVSVSPANDLEGAWPHRWAARVVVRLGGERMEETVIQAPFDYDAPGLREILQEKWRRMLPEHDLTLLDQGQPDGAPYATLWNEIERRVRTATED
jgi:2-methylcitrate dehydratase PrpD